MSRYLAPALVVLMAGSAAAQTPLLPPGPMAPQAPMAPPSPAPPGATPSAPPQTIPPPQALAPLEAGPATPPAAPTPAAEAAPPVGRVFCDQPVGYRVANPDTVALQYRDFVGIWSDAAWAPQLCAALIVESVQPDGTAAILYAFGPMGSGTKGPGGVLRGTGIIRDGELKFQNNDGSQYAFKPFYADLTGTLITPQGQNYQAIFKKTY